MKYAVVGIGGSQYKVQEKDQIVVDRLPQEEGDSLKFGNVFLVVDGDKTKIGKPILKEAHIEAKVIKNFLGDKLDIFKFKAKTGYRRKTGFRPEETLLNIEKIQG